MWSWNYDKITENHKDRLTGRHNCPQKECDFSSSFGGKDGLSQWHASLTLELLLMRDVLHNPVSSFTKSETPFLKRSVDTEALIWRISFFSKSGDSPTEFQVSWSSCKPLLPACPDCSFLPLPGCLVLARLCYLVLRLPCDSVYLLPASWCSPSLRCPFVFLKNLLLVLH